MEKKTVELQIGKLQKSWCISNILFWTGCFQGSEARISCPLIDTLMPPFSHNLLLAENASAPTVSKVNESGPKINQVSWKTGTEDLLVIKHWDGCPKFAVCVSKP